MKKVLASYLYQEHVEEVIIVDDCSQDDTAQVVEAIAQSNPLLKYVRNDVNSGQAFSKNRGASIAKCEYVLFGEDDLIFSNKYARELLERIEESSSASIIAGRLIYLKSENIPPLSDIPYDKSSYCSPYTLKANFNFYSAGCIEVPFVHACALVKKEVFEKVRFDETYDGNAAREETDFYLSALEKGFKSYYCAEAVCYHLPKTFEKTGSWKHGLFAYQISSIKNHNRFIDKHYEFLKKQGIFKSPKTAFKLFHMVNRIRLLLMAQFNK